MPIEIVSTISLGLGSGAAAMCKYDVVRDVNVVVQLT
jgi:hypothetical protein